MKAAIKPYNTGYFCDNRDTLECQGHENSSVTYTGYLLPDILESTKSGHPIHEKIYRPMRNVRHGLSQALVVENPDMETEIVLLTLMVWGYF